MNVDASGLLESMRKLLSDTLDLADSIDEHLIAANVSMALELTMARLAGPTT